MYIFCLFSRSDHPWSRLVGKTLLPIWSPAPLPQRLRHFHSLTGAKLSAERRADALRLSGAAGGSRSVLRTGPNFRVPGGKDSTVIS